MQAINWLRENKFTVELLLAVLLLTASILHYYQIQGAREAIILFAYALAGLYFLSAFFVPDQTMPLLFATVGIKVINISSAVSIVGITFVLIGGEGALEMLMIGLLSLGAAGLLVLYFAVTTRNSSLFMYLIRVVILGGITGYMFLNLYKPESL